MNHFNLPKGLLDSVSKVMKETKVDNTPLQEKLIQGNQAAVKSTTDFDKAVASVVAEGRKKAAQDQAKFFEASVAAHKGMGKSIAESTTVEVKASECIIAESAFAEIATRMKNIGTARRMQSMTEQKETIAQMTRTFAASFDQVIEANLSAEVLADKEVSEAINEVKAEIRTQMLNAVNVANAARVVDESAKIVAMLEAKGAMKKKSDSCTDPYEVGNLKTRHTKTGSDAVDEAKKLDPIGKEDDDVNNDGKVDSSDSYLKNRRKSIAKNIKEDQVEEGKVLDTLKKVGKKALETLGHGSDEDLRKDLQKKMGAKPEQQHGKKSMATYNEEVEQLDELGRTTLTNYVTKVANQRGAQAGSRTAGLLAAAKKLRAMKKKPVVAEDIEQIDEKDIGKHNNATTGFKAMVKKLTPKYGAEGAAKIAGAEKKKVMGEEVEQVEEERSTGTVFDAKVAAEFKKKKPGESAGFDSKKTSTGTVYNRKPKKEDEEVKEGVELSVEEAERIAQLAKDLGL